MKPFVRTINLGGITGSTVNEVHVTRTTDSLYWCKAVPFDQTVPIDLGPVRFDSQARTFTPHFDLHQVGTEHAAMQFMTLLNAQLVKAGLA